MADVTANFGNVVKEQIELRAVPEREEYELFLDQDVNTFVWKCKNKGVAVVLMNNLIGGKDVRPPDERHGEVPLTNPPPATDSPSLEMGGSESLPPTGDDAEAVWLDESSLEDTDLSVPESELPDGTLAPVAPSPIIYTLRCAVRPRWDLASPEDRRIVRLALRQVVADEDIFNVPIPPTSPPGFVALENAMRTARDFKKVLSGCKTMPDLPVPPLLQRPSSRVPALPPPSPTDILAAPAEPPVPESDSAVSATATPAVTDEKKPPIKPFKAKLPNLGNIILRFELTSEDERALIADALQTMGDGDPNCRIPDDPHLPYAEIRRVTSERKDDPKAALAECRRLADARIEAEAEAAIQAAIAEETAKAEAFAAEQAAISRENAIADDLEAEYAAILANARTDEPAEEEAPPPTPRQFVPEETTAEMKPVAAFAPAAEEPPAASETATPPIPPPPAPMAASAPAAEEPPPAPPVGMPRPQPPAEDPPPPSNVRQLHPTGSAPAAKAAKAEPGKVPMKKPDPPPAAAAKAPAPAVAPPRPAPRPAPAPAPKAGASANEASPAAVPPPFARLATASPDVADEEPEAKAEAPASAGPAVGTGEAARTAPPPGEQRPTPSGRQLMPTIETQPTVVVEGGSPSSTPAPSVPAPPAQQPAATWTPRRAVGPIRVVGDTDPQAEKGPASPPAPRPADPGNGQSPTVQPIASKAKAPLAPRRNQPTPAAIVSAFILAGLGFLIFMANVPF